MNQSDAEWVEATFGVAFIADDQDLAPDATTAGPDVPGARDIAHVLRSVDENARATVGGIDDVMAARPPRRDADGRSVLFEQNGEYCLWLDYSKVVIGPEEFEVWAMNPIGPVHGQVVRRGSTADLRRLVALWADHCDESWPAYEAFEEGRPPPGT